MNDRRPAFMVAGFSHPLDELARLSRRVAPMPENPTEFPRWTEVSEPEALAAYAAMRAKEEEGNTLNAQLEQVSKEYDRLKRRFLRILATKHTAIADESAAATWREFEGKLYYVGTDAE